MRDHHPSGAVEQSREAERAWQEFVVELRSGPTRPFEEHWSRFLEIFADREEEDGPPIVWRPTPEQIERSNLGRFMKERGFASYPELHAWSVEDRAGFWETVVEHLGIVFSKRPSGMLDLEKSVQDPSWLPGAEMNCVDSCFTASPEKPAVVFGKEGSDDLHTSSYGELEQLVNRFANGLRQRGFRSGDSIALYMPMNLACIAAYLGTVRAGCRVVSIADSFPPEEIRRRIGVADATGIVTVEGYLRAGKLMRLYEKVQAAGAPLAIVLPAGDELERGLRAGDVAWDDFLGTEDSFSSETGDPYRVVNVLFSSGTTGTPKAIPWTHLTPIKCAMDGRFHQDIRADDVIAWPTNIGWMMGPWLIYSVMINRATIALYEGAPTGDGFARFVRDTGVTLLGVVPSLVRAWRSSGVTEGLDWSRVRVFSSTGEPSNRQDYLWLMSRAGYRAPVIEYCGGTEIGGGHLTGTTVQPASPAAFTTPALGLDFAILDEQGKPVPEGSSGEIFLIPPSIGLSQSLLNGDHGEAYYRGCPEGPEGQVLRRHGDEVARLHQGFFKAMGRADDSMNLGGIKVGSQEIEAVVDAHPAVYESAAVAVQPEGEGAEALVVFAVVRGRIERERLLEELRSVVAKELNPLFRIHDLSITDALPRTASNKIMRRELRRGFMQEKGDVRLTLERGVPLGGRVTIPQGVFDRLEALYPDSDLETLSRPLLRLQSESAPEVWNQCYVPFQASDGRLGVPFALGGITPGAWWAHLWSVVESKPIRIEVPPGGVSDLDLRFETVE